MARFKKEKPAFTPDDREAQMISLAIDCAERQMREGTASSQIITHYLKLAASTTELEKKKVEQEIKLTEAKIEGIKSDARMEQLFSDAIAAMRSYSGTNEQTVEEDDDDEYDY